MTDTDRSPRLLVVPRRPLAEGRENVLEVLVRVQAPDASPASTEDRPLGLNLALVIDRSGSMEGAPLEEAKRSAAMVVERLRPTDRAAVVTYDNRADVVVASSPVEDRERFRKAIAAIPSGGQTDLHGGWLAGAREAAPHTGPRVLSRVLLLSDGQANHGLLDGVEILRQVEDFAEAGVGTSTYGLGHSFNEDLMAAIARSGRGLAHYGESADDLREPFETELDLLDALWARNLVLRIHPAPGVGTGLLNDYPMPRAGGWVLPDLVYGGEAWALVKVRVAKPTAPEQSLFAVEVAYTDPNGEPYVLTVPTASVAVLSEEEARRAPDDELVARRAAELAAARLQEAAREAVHRGDWAAAEALVGDAEKLAAESPWVGDVAASLREILAERDSARFLKEAKIASGRMGRRLTMKDELAAPMPEEEPSFLRRKRWQGKKELR